MEKRTVITEIVIFNGNVNYSSRSFMKNSEICHDESLCIGLISNTNISKLVSSTSLVRSPSTNSITVVNVYDCIYVELKWNITDERMCSLLKEQIKKLSSTVSDETQKAMKISEMLKSTTDVLKKTLYNVNGKAEILLDSLVSNEISIDQYFSELRSFFIN